MYLGHDNIGAIMRVGITIDWDYFIPDALKGTSCQYETEYYLLNWWRGFEERYGKINTSGVEKRFWSVLRDYFLLPNTVIVSDSHKYAYDVMFGCDLVINFDAHHDCFDVPKPCDVKALSNSYFDEKTLNKVRMGCGNWGGFLLRSDDKLKFIWVNPNTYGKFPFPREFDDRIEVCGNENIIGKFEDLISLNMGHKITINSLHICRSGAWSPPWLDDKFIKFVLKSEARPIVVGPRDNWHPLLSRKNVCRSK